MEEAGDVIKLSKTNSDHGSSKNDLLEGEPEATMVKSKSLVGRTRSGTGNASGSDGTEAKIESWDVFMSYPRGEITTPFARWLRGKLEENGFSVWMDEVSIKAGSDWRLQIGTAIRQSASLIAVIDDKFNQSMHCKNEVNMMSDQGKPIFPIIFRSFSLSNLSLDLQYTLNSRHMLFFTHPRKDDKTFEALLDGMCVDMFPTAVAVENSVDDESDSEFQEKDGEVPKPELAKTVSLASVAKALSGLTHSRSSRSTMDADAAVQRQLNRTASMIAATSLAKSKTNSGIRRRNSIIEAETLEIVMTEDLSSWFDGLRLTEFKDTFRDEGFLRFEDILHAKLTDDDLKHLGMTKLANRKVFMNAYNVLLASNGASALLGPDVSSVFKDLHNFLKYGGIESFMDVLIGEGFRHPKDFIGASLTDSDLVSMGIGTLRARKLLLGLINLLDANGNFKIPFHISQLGIANDTPSSESGFPSAGQPHSPNEVIKVTDYALSEGRVYSGETRNFVMQGKGTLKWPDGKVYEGDFVDGQMEGSGTMTWSDGRVYVGAFTHNNRVGIGKQMWTDGRVYSGSFKNGVPHNIGRMEWPNGDVFEGSFEGGKPVISSGRWSTVPLVSPSPYPAELSRRSSVNVSGSPTGKKSSISGSVSRKSSIGGGKDSSITASSPSLASTPNDTCSSSVSRDSTLISTCVPVLPSAQYSISSPMDPSTGTPPLPQSPSSVVSTNSNYLVSSSSALNNKTSEKSIGDVDANNSEGDIKACGQKDLIYFPDGRVYIGQRSADGAMHGIGVLIFPNGKRYEGSFANNLMHGNGVLTSPNNRRFVGIFNQNKRSGKGIEEMTDGRLYYGDFIDGRVHGVAKLCMPDGRTFIGDFADGRPVHGEWFEKDPNTGDWPKEEHFAYSKPN